MNQSVHATLHVSNNGFGRAFDRIVVSACLQDPTAEDLTRLATLNVQDAQRVAVLNGEIGRVKKGGGDYLVFPNGHHPAGSKWLTLACLEQGGNSWCKVAIVPAPDEPVF